VQSPAAGGRVFNIGSDQPVTILDLAKRVIELARSTSTVEFQSYAQAYDADFEDIRHRVPDLTRLRTTIGYQPTFDLDGIISDVIASKRASIAE
jgi:UDP-glucose 4-epimerase